MTSSSGRPSMSRAASERRRSWRRRYSSRTSGTQGVSSDNPLTPVLPEVPDIPTALPGIESPQRSARQSRAPSKRYSNVNLPEVVRSDSTVAVGSPGRMRALQEEEQQMRARKSDKFFVSARSARGSRDRGGPNKGMLALTEGSLTAFYTICHLIFFSILGTLARLGLEALTFYPSVVVTSPVLWANVGGSFIMGFLVEDQHLFREEWGLFDSRDDWSFHPDLIESGDAEVLAFAWQNHDKVKRTIPLFRGLAVGFCGSFTSFSSFIRDAFLALSNRLDSHTPNDPASPSRNGGYSFEALLAVIILHVTISIAALKFGAHLALAMEGTTPTIPYKTTRQVIDPVVAALGFTSWLAAIIITIRPPNTDWRGQALFATVFAPLGCLARFYMSRWLNPRSPNFPTGTFVVNVVGTFILGVAYDLQHVSSVDVVGSQVLQGVQDGFCGCLTTVSTWVAEMAVLRRKHGYIYGLLSIAVSLAFLIVIIGSLQWSRGLATPAWVM